MDFARKREKLVSTSIRPERIVWSMLTVIETELFQKLWPAYWTEEERGEFASFLSANPTAGDVVPESGGVRKIRRALEP